MERIAVAAALFLASVTPAASWSEAGHRIVCAIAWKELSAEARVALARLLEDDPAASLPEACIWADTIRGNPAYDWARPHHYINVPKDAGGIDLARDCPPRPGCVISAIGIHRGTLSDPSASSADKVQALKFLSHFIGDIHQPLHVGRAEDRGANAIRGSASLARRRSCTPCGMRGSSLTWSWTGRSWLTGSRHRSSTPGGSRGADPMCATGRRSRASWPRCGCIRNSRPAGP